MTQPIVLAPGVRARHSASACRQVGTPVTSTSVLVGVDGTSTGRDALALADLLCEHDGPLTLAHVVLTQGPVYRNFAATPAGKDALKMLASEGGATRTARELTGMFAPSVARGLHQLAEDCDAHLLTVGSCRRPLIGRLLHGDNTQATVAGAPCPVAVAPSGYARQPRTIETIGVAYNGSPESEAALALARTLATRRRASLHVLTVVWPTTSLVWPASRAPLTGAPPTMTFEAVEQAAGKALRSLTGVNATLIVGIPSVELLRFGDQVDLLLVGSRNHGRVRRRLLGSTSRDLVRSLRCPVLVVPRRTPDQPQPSS
jgi:nucleotide-binding universal stress UspA family protein